MIRVDTLESEKIYNELKAFEKSIAWNGNEYIGSLKDVQFLITPAMSTRSIYVKIATVSKEFKDMVEIRISDHQSGMKATDKDIYFTFDNFDMNVVKEIYNSKLN